MPGLSPTADRLLRLVAALLVAVSGAVHLQLWFQRYDRIDVIGPLFLVNVVVSGLAAVFLVARGGLPSVLAGLGVTAGSLVAYVISTTVGLFGYIDRAVEWQDVVAKAAEGAAVVLLVAWLAVAFFGSRRDDALERDLGRFSS